MVKYRGRTWARYVACMREKRNACRFLIGKPEGKRPLGRPKRRWGNNIEMDLRKIGWSCMDWIDLPEDSDH
jgi:hypothetical protein